MQSTVRKYTVPNAGNKDKNRTDAEFSAPVIFILTQTPDGDIIYQNKCSERRQSGSGNKKRKTAVFTYFYIYDKI